MVFDGNRHTDKGHDDKHCADYAVYEPESAHIEATAQLVDEICHHIPPNDSPAENSEVGPDLVEELILGQNEVKPGVKTYDKKEYQRI